MLGPIVTERSKRALALNEGLRRTRRQQCPEQTRVTSYQSSIRRRYGTTTYGRRDADDEGEDGLHDERPQVFYLNIFYHIINMVSKS